jgi:hypothetical protein
MTPADIIESAKLAGASLAIEDGNLAFSAPADWFLAHQEDIKKHHRAIIMLLKLRESERAGFGNVIDMASKRRHG